MKVTLNHIKVKDLFAGFKEDFATDLVTGYGGRLDIRPKFQRAYVYKDAQRDAVIETVLKGFPLNVMYWAVKPDGTYEVVDGQQRTISICQYLQGDFSVGGKYFCNQPDDVRAAIEDYELTVYFCEGTESEKLDWFRVINIAGERLEQQELCNASYVGPWVVDAKKYFSPEKGMAYLKWRDYLTGECKRQKWLETVIGWIAGDDSDAATALEKRVAELMADDDVQRKSAVYEYLLGGEQTEHADKILNLRGFTLSQRRAAYERQKSLCKICGKPFAFEDMHGDHATPWSRGGKTTPDNLQMLCTTCNLSKGAKL